MSRKTIFIVSATIAVAFFGVWLLSPSSGDKQTNKTETVVTLQDAHGLAVDRRDSSKVYVATHTGLLVMFGDGELTQVSNDKDDYMGFSAHPTDANTFYTSGHPSHGGNLGFQKSIDGGKTWQKVSDGIDGPVDFHAMAVGQVDPKLVYGFYQGQLQRSSDEGKTWKILNDSPQGIITLATSTTAKDTVYAGTTDGLHKSKNQGDDWSKLSVIDNAITALALHPKNDQELFAYEQARGLMRSEDSGSTWSITGYKDSMVMHLAYDPQNPATIYLINQDLEVHKSSDEGKTWKKIR